MNKREVIALCVRRCARYADGRGPWQAQRSCASELFVQGQRYPLAIETAAAARRVGVSIRDAALKAQGR